MLVPSRTPSRIRRLEPATTLAEMAQTLMPDPLDSKESMDAFYVPEIQALRGLNRMGEMQLSIEDALAAQIPFKGFLLGHPGVGKTTELRHLLQGMDTTIRPLWLDVITELNPGTLRFYDVLLLILIRLVEAASSPTIVGFTEQELAVLLARVKGHLSTKWSKHLRVDQKEFSGGFQLPFLAKLLANMKVGSTNESGSQEYELSFVSDLVSTVNDVLLECNRLLAKHKNGQQWLIVVENFEKIGLPPGTVRDLFIGLRPHFQDLWANMVVTIPAWLQYSEDASFVLPTNFHSFLLHDIPVYTKDHVRDEESIRAISKVIEARANTSLFEPGVLDHCIVASGGNLRDLFTICRDSMLAARIRKSPSIGSEDAAGAIASLRNGYKESLGAGSQVDPKSISLADKLKCLKALYERKDLTAEVPGPVLYQLLRQRCVLQYNGSGWKGVHPLVVDLLIEFEQIAKNSPGGSMT